MKKYLNYTLTAFALCALMACSEDTSSSRSSGLAPDGGKELIAFSQKGSAMTTRAMTRDGFTADTKVVMRIKAEGAAATDIRYTQAVATASAQIASDACNTDYGLVGSHSHLTYAAGQNRYWDDAFGRDSKLTVYAVAVPNSNLFPLAGTRLLLRTPRSTGKSLRFRLPPLALMKTLPTATISELVRLSIRVAITKPTILLPPIGIRVWNWAV